MQAEKQPSTETLEALEGLYRFYCDALLSRHELDFLPVDSSDQWQAEKKELLHRSYAIVQGHDQAKKRLFATGYDVPAEWLAVKPFWTMSELQEADENGAIVGIVTLAQPDHDALERVTWAMKNEFLGWRPLCGWKLLCRLKPRSAVVAMPWGKGALPPEMTSSLSGTKPRAATPIIPMPRFGTSGTACLSVTGRNSALTSQKRLAAAKKAGEL